MFKILSDWSIAYQGNRLIAKTNIFLTWLSWEFNLKKKVKLINIYVKHIVECYAIEI